MAAPIAHFDDDWPNEGELGLLSRLVVPQKGCVPAGDAELEEDELPDGGLFPGDCGAFRSMEDLVKDFDEKLSVCFQIITRRRRCLLFRRIWTALTQSYSQVMPVDWKQSLTCSLHTPCEKEVPFQVSDDEELREQLDMHTMIITSLTDEPLLTADQVIEEIEEMMQESPDPAHNTSQSHLTMLSLDVQRITSPQYKERIRGLTVAELNERLEETECAIRRLSEELVQQLALRDEQDFEKEVKNSFISALIDVQNRQKEHRETLKKKKKLKGAAGTSNSYAEKSLGAYLTTVIPYAKTGHPPANEDLQVLTKILLAMRDDSDKVPSLLTDYILKGKTVNTIQ
uniref:Si:dkey-288i20.2 n=1 Tax=Neogobius melanostomus TaxID=47308 RepID=A0A8C6WJ05_9GOBI